MKLFADIKSWKYPILCIFRVSFRAWKKAVGINLIVSFLFFALVSSLINMMIILKDIKFLQLNHNFFIFFAHYKRSNVQKMMKFNQTQK